MEHTERLELAGDFLREAVYRSRARQATAGVLAPPAAQDAQRSAALGNCGLGEKAAVVLDLDERGRALFERLFGDEAPDVPALERVHATMTEWIRRQDGLDRKRNHFLKDFRNRHGFDRRAYTADQERAYDEGLATVNAEIERELLQAAQGLLGA